VPSGAVMMTVSPTFLLRTNMLYILEETRKQNLIAAESNRKRTPVDQ